MQLFSGVIEPLMNKCCPMKFKPVSPKMENTVPQWPFKLNTFPVTAENWHLTGSMLKHLIVLKWLGNQGVCNRILHIGTHPHVKCWLMIIIPIVLLQRDSITGAVPRL
jgi:hypothetical protein